MRTDKVSVFDLFEKQRRYLVPLFQRGYVWGRSEQWEPLWRDILAQAMPSPTPFSGTAPLRKHFLGAIVLNQVDTGILRVPTTEVVDGQQRLVTLQLLLAALRDAIGGMANRYLVGVLQRLTANSGPLHDQDEQFKVWPTVACREELRDAMEAGSPEALADQYPQRRVRGRFAPRRPPLVEAYFYFSQEIARYLSGGEGPRALSDSMVAQRAERLIDALTRRVQLVSIELDAEDDPQVIFETLNARGVPLQPSDLIRNYLFLDAVRRGEDAEHLYDKWWRDFDEDGAGAAGFWKETERQGQWKRSHLDLFLFHHLTFRTRRPFSISHLFQAFRDWWETPGNGRAIDAELETLHRSAGVFRSLLVPEEGSPVELFSGRLRGLNPSPVYPLVLWLSEQKDALPDGEFAGILDDLASYLLRRANSGSTARNYHRTFVGVVDRLSREGVPTRAALRRELTLLEGIPEAEGELAS